MNAVETKLTFAQMRNISRKNLNLQCNNRFINNEVNIYLVVRKISGFDKCKDDNNML